MNSGTTLRSKTYL